MNFFNYSILIILFFTTNLAFSQSENTSSDETRLGLNSELTSKMMEPNQNLRKIEILMDAKSDGLIEKKSLSLGFSVIGIIDYQKSNTNSKFAYLMRHPTSGNQIGETASEAVIHSAQVSFVGSANDWLTVYGEMLYSPEQSFGAGTITSLGRNQVQLRKAIILVGNLKTFPLYLALGKMDIPFGQTRTVSPFTNSTMWHAFGPIGYGAVVGFKESGFSGSLAAIQGGAQFRALAVPVDSTNVPSRINNFAADINYTLEINENTKIKVGASYLKGTSYCHPWPVFHFNPCDESNPAYTFYGELDLSNKLVVQGAYAKTQKVWPGTHNPNPPLNEFAAAKVSSISAGAKYQLNDNANVIYSLSAEYSDFVAGPAGSPWEKQTQIVIGLNAQVEKTSRLFLEVFNTTGYSPLNFISGGNFTDPGVTHSDRDATSLGIVVGVLFSI